MFPILTLLLDVPSGIARTTKIAAEREAVALAPEAAAAAAAAAVYSSAHQGANLNARNSYMLLLLFRFRPLWLLPFPMQAPEVAECFSAKL